ncbi:MAG: exodeoxyribonuclease VII large subunit [Nitrospirae bacterium]|nr:exodeoxyribonuclease VII large subunit [Nitrospirota bacterium]
MQIPLDLPERHILTVSRLTGLIKTNLEGSFYDIWMEGEISNLRIPTSGHIYLTLKDEASQIRAVIFKPSLRNIKFELKDGLHIICHGRVTVYETRGEYQIVIDMVEPQGIGALQLAFEQLKERLSKEGLFDTARKRPIPLLPKKIGIITSPTGAAIRDILNIINRRFANVHILINPVPVQGEGAAQEIARAIAEMNEFEDIDAIIVGRGGGSLEDLWAFNEEIVARAIYNSRIPVISAVGHEIDYTISDFVADLRAPTPSAAAELVVKNKADLMNNLGHLFLRIKNGVSRLLDAKRSILREYIRAMKDPSTKISEYIQRVDDLSMRLSAGISRRLDSLRKMAESAAGRLNALSPLAILSRGYSITMRHPDMEIIKNIDEVKKGDEINIRLHKGDLAAVVSKINPAKKT